MEPGQLHGCSLALVTELESRASASREFHLLGLEERASSGKEAGRPCPERVAAPEGDRQRTKDAERCFEGTLRGRNGFHRPSPEESTSPHQGCNGAIMDGFPSSKLCFEGDGSRMLTGCGSGHPAMRSFPILLYRVAEQEEHGQAVLGLRISALRLQCEVPQCALSSHKGSSSESGGRDPYCVQHRRRDETASIFNLVPQDPRKPDAVTHPLRSCCTFKRVVSIGVLCPLLAISLLWYPASLCCFPDVLCGIPASRLSRPWDIHRFSRCR